MRVLGVALLVFAVTAVAEMDSSDYSSGAVSSDPERLKRLRDEVAAERRAEARRAAEREAAAIAERARLDAERATRPYPERLIEVRCHSCHAPEVLARTRHTRAGWYLTITRMRWFNGAAMENADALALAAYLAQVQPARGSRALVEYAGLVLIPFAPLALWLGWRRWRSA